MTIEVDEIVRRIRAAFVVLAARDLALLEMDANERTVTHKFAEYLQREFMDWDVDCEYNRDGHDPKRLSLRPSTVSTDDTKATSVFPDVIVHRRGSRENLVVIEAKKSTTASTGHDELKLSNYKSQLGYQFAFSIVLPVGEQEAVLSGADLIVVEVS